MPERELILGLSSKGAVAPGRDADLADLIVLDEDLALQGVIIAGEVWKS